MRTSRTVEWVGTGAAVISAVTLSGWAAKTWHLGRGAELLISVVLGGLLNLALILAVRSLARTR